MKNLLIPFFVVCSLHAYAQPFHWLAGKWKLRDKTIYEVWKAENGITLKGWSYKVSGTDTMTLERITVTKLDDAFYYIPDVAENAMPVKFRVRAFTDSSFVAENPQHDFPKIIRYTIVRKDDREIIEAFIEGNGKVIPYTFDKVK